MLVSFPLLPGTRNWSNLSTNAVRLIVSGIDGAMEDERLSRNQWRHAWTLRSCWRRAWSYSLTSSTSYFIILFSLKMDLLSIWNDLVGEALGVVIGQVPQVTQQFCSALGSTLHLYGMTWSPGLSLITQSQENITPPPSVLIKKLVLVINKRTQSTSHWTMCSWI